MQKEESTLEVKENFSSLQEEVDVKTKKLNKVAVVSDALLSNVLLCSWSQDWRPLRLK